MRYIVNKFLVPHILPNVGGLFIRVSCRQIVSEPLTPLGRDVIDVLMTANYLDPEDLGNVALCRNDRNWSYYGKIVAKFYFVQTMCHLVHC